MSPIAKLLLGALYVLAAVEFVNVYTNKTMSHAKTLSRRRNKRNNLSRSGVSSIFIDLVRR